MKLSERFDRRYQQTPIAPAAMPAAPSPNGPGVATKPAAPPPLAIVTAPSIPVPHGVDTESSSKLTPSLAAAKAEIHSQLLAHHTAQIDINNPAGIRRLLLQLTEEHFRTKPPATLVTPSDRERLVEVLFDEVVGLGPLEALLRDPDVSEVMVNRPIGRRVDESEPMCDARLKDGSRVNVVIPPVAIYGPCLTIRKFGREVLSPDQIVSLGGATPAMMTYLDAAVKTRLNIIVSGGTGSGKTTFLNVLSGFIPATERIVTCEDAAELRLRQVHVISLESKPQNVEGRGAITIRDLVRNCLRMRPDRIVVGECRGAEALDMLQAMNTGHDGSMSTLHSNNPRDALNRLETLVLLAGTELPSRAIRSQIASAVNVVVQTERLRGGARKVVSVAEVTGIADGEITMQELFVFSQTGVTAEGVAVGFHTATGVRSAFIKHFRSNGVDLPDAMFQPATQPPAGRQ